MYETVLDGSFLLIVFVICQVLYVIGLELQQSKKVPANEKAGLRFHDVTRETTEQRLNQKGCLVKTAQMDPFPKPAVRVCVGIQNCPLG